MPLKAVFTTHGAEFDLDDESPKRQNKFYN